MNLDLTNVIEVVRISLHKRDAGANLVTNCWKIRTKEKRMYLKMNFISFFKVYN